MSPLDGQIVYHNVVLYLQRNGWRREEKGSGWWWSETEPELITMGEALDKQLLADGVDLRVEP
jgi:hypothetical protein